MLQKCEAFLVVPVSARTQQMYQFNKMGFPIRHKNYRYQHAPLLCDQLDPNFCDSISCKCLLSRTVHQMQILHVVHLSRTCLQISVFAPFQKLGGRTMVKQHHAKKNAKAPWCGTFCNQTTCSWIWYLSLWKWENAFHFASTKIGQRCILMEKNWTQSLSGSGIHIHCETLTAKKQGGQDTSA